MKQIKYILLVLTILTLTGCKTKTVVVTVPEVRTDTTYITKEQRDSIWLHDSIYVSEKQKDDTIYLYQERWHTKYVERLSHDTIYQHKVDSVGVPYPVEVKVEKKLNWWQNMRMTLGTIALIGIFLWIVGQCIKLYMKRF